MQRRNGRTRSPPDKEHVFSHPSVPTSVNHWGTYPERLDGLLLKL